MDIRNACQYDDDRCLNEEQVVFTYRKYDVELVRELDPAMLGWPDPGDAVNESGLGSNRAYVDLRNLSWGDAKRVLALEGELIARIEQAEDTDAECETIDDELYESDQDLFGLDLGVASTVASLSAASCVPFSSCNAAAFGGDHHESFPLVVFFAKAPMVDLLLAAATEADIGLATGVMGSVLAYSDDIRKFRAFAQRLISSSGSFRAVLKGTGGRRKREPRSDRPKVLEQYQLPLT
jgi:hypothetical protein